MRRLIFAGMTGLLAIAVSAAAQEAQVGISVTRDVEGVQLLQATDFTLRPSVTTSTVGAGVQTLPLVVNCFDLFTGQILPNCNVTISHQPTPNSGGHNHHSASRPKGTFQPSSGSTGTSGLATTYTSPEVSGVIEVTITGTTAQGQPVIPGFATIGVEIGGLATLSAGTNYDLIGATGTHPDNHYGTAGMNGSLVTLADSYAAAFTGGRLAYNDMSLVTGGLFDISAGWSRPHSSHRFGTDVDLRLVAAANRRRLRQLITAAGISQTIVEGDHWHLRQ
jgi:hypothetical protein